MPHIIEYIGKNKIIHSEFNHTRAQHPHPGDIIDVGENEGTYPYIYGKYGRVDGLNHFGTDKISLCCELGSCFLCEDYVSVSGGPFDTINPDELEPTYDLHIARFWNWGNNLPGAGKGIDYYPVFKLRKRTAEDKERVNKAFEMGEA